MKKLELFNLTEDNFNKNKKLLLEILKQRSLLKGDFTLASGQKSNFYLDARLTTLSPDGINLISHCFLYLIKQLQLEIKIIAGPPLGSCPIVNGICQMSYFTDKQLKACFVRKETKDHGTQKLIEGSINKGEEVLLVEDVITSGNSALSAVKKLRDYGCEVKYMMCLILRDEKAIEIMKKENIELIYIFKSEEIINTFA